MSDTKPPGSDDLDAAYAEVRRDPYGFTWMGREWTLCHFGELDIETQDAIERSSEMDMERLKQLFVEAMGEQQADDWSRVRRPPEFLSMLFERWLKHSGAKPGEGSASSGSSKSTGGRSRRTSGGSTASASRSRSTAKRAAPANRAAKKAASPPGKSSP